jgi:hypothetical protein
LAGDIGGLSTLPATAEPLGRDQSSTASREFLLDEAAGVLVHGTAAEAIAAARELHNFIRKEQAPDFFARLEAAIGNDPIRLAFLEVLYSFGQPRFSGPGDTAADPPLNVVKWASERLARSPQRAQLLAATLLENMELAYWAAPLLEAADHSQFIPGLRRALQEGRASALYLAWELMRMGDLELLPDATARAFEIADDPSLKGQELQMAGRVVGEHGSEAELKAYALLVRKYRDVDPAFYSRLWQTANFEGAKNAGYVLAVVLEDQRIAFRDVRYADMAAGALQRQTGEDFGFEPNAPLFARDRSIARALAWLSERGYVQ